jgi:ribosomal protein L16 Arg81 hydroxylase
MADRSIRRRHKRRERSAMMCASRAANLQHSRYFKNRHGGRMDRRSDLIDFWRVFARQYWEKKPLARDNVFSDLPINEPELFKVVKRSCDLSKDRNGVQLRLFVDGEAQDVYGAYKLFPKDADNSFESYHKRLEAELKGKKYSLIINHLEAHSFPLWAWSRGFLRGLYDQVGMNTLGVYYALFMGNYKETPFGVHHDPESVFHLPVIGTKRMRTWSSSYVVDNPRLKMSTQYQDHIKESTLLQASPGGFVYWPSDSWHIGEYSGELSVSLALSLNCVGSLVEPLLAQIREQYHATNNTNKVTIKIRSDALQESVQRLPEVMVEAGEFINKRSNNDYLRHIWLKTVTGYNFMYVPVPIELPPLQLDDYVVGSSEYPILIMQLEGNQLAVSSNGHILNFPDTMAVRALINEINKGIKLRIGDLSDVNNINLGTRETLEILNQLQWIRAIWKVNGDADLT